MSEYDSFLRVHPHLERYHDAPAKIAPRVSESRKSRSLLATPDQTQCDRHASRLRCNCARHRLS